MLLRRHIIVKTGSIWVRVFYDSTEHRIYETIVSGWYGYNISTEWIYIFNPLSLSSSAQYELSLLVSPIKCFFLGVRLDGVSLIPAKSQSFSLAASFDSSLLTSIFYFGDAMVTESMHSTTICNYNSAAVLYQLSMTTSRKPLLTRIARYNSPCDISTQIIIVDFISWWRCVR